MALGKRRAAQLFAGIAVIGLLLVWAPATACLTSHHGNMMGSASRLPQDPVVSPSDSMTVEIKGYDFTPRDLTVFEGARITWVNRDDVPHNATSDQGGWATEMLNSGQEGTLAFDEPGTFDYLCTIHPDMKAKLVVRADAAAARGTIASDADKHVSEQYEAMDASMHPGVKPGHTFVLVLKGGQTSWRWDWFGHGKAMYMEVDDIYDSVKKGVARGS